MTESVGDPFLRKENVYMECNSGRIITRAKNGKELLFIRLNFVEIKNGKKVYHTKDYPTGLEDKRKNYPAAYTMMDAELKRHASFGGNMMVSQYCKEWLAKKEGKIESTTYEGYVYRMGHICRYFDARGLSMAEVTSQDVETFYDSLFYSGNNCGSAKDKRLLSNRSVKDIAVLFRQIFAYAALHGHISVDPTLKIAIPKLVADKKNKPYIAAEEVPAFLEEIRGHRLELPILFAIYFGLRRAEICGLRWSAIRGSEIFIEHTVVTLKTTVAKDRTKTDASFRSYPITPEIQEKLDAIKKQQDENRKLFGSSYHESDYIFTWEDGRPYAPDYLTKEFKTIVRQSKVFDSDLTLHSLRYSCVSMLVHSGADIKDIQTWVGHSDIKTTLDIYAQTNKYQKNKTADKMTGLIFKPVETHRKNAV